MRDTARILWQLYLGLTIIEVLLLMFAGLSFFDALANTFGTMPTGGFSPKDLSIAAYNNVYVEIIIIVFMTLAGSNFQLYYLLLWKRKFKTVLTDRELRYYLLILAGAGLLITLNLLMSMELPAATALRYAIFQVVSIQTTTGFATTDFAVWPAFSRLALLVLMVIGASASSTGGALKVVRIVVLVKYAFRQVSLVFNPRKVQPLKLAGKVLSDKVISEILGLSILYFALLVIGSLLMSLFGLDPISAISATVASLGNVGPGLGVVGPLANYSFIPDLGKLLLTMLMLIGRLELWAVLVIFTSAFWRWRGRPSDNSSL
jgi:trk system potassium uptake protein TrkH